MGLAGKTLVAIVVAMMNIMGGVIGAVAPASTPTPTPAPAPAPAPPPPTNITAVLSGAGDFTSFLRLLESTDLAKVFQAQANMSDVGITVFAPVDKAFSALPPSTLQNLTAVQTAALIRYHATTKFISLPELQQMGNEAVATLATGTDGGGHGYNLNVTQSGGSVVLISSGHIRAPLTTTLINGGSVAMFGTAAVLQPEEIFGIAPPTPAPAPTPALPPTAPGSSSSPSSPSVAAGPGATTGTVASSGPSQDSKNGVAMAMPTPFPLLFLASLALFCLHSV